MTQERRSRRVAFYAPMKPPDDPVPSGDREIARLTLRALDYAGYQPVLASRFRARDGVGDPAHQALLTAEAAKEADRVIAELRDDPPVAWLTYHSYYKAPDLIGPRVAEALGLPYAITEPSISPKRRDGPWAAFARLSEASIATADRLFWTTERDRPALEEAGHRERMEKLPAFIDVGPDPGPARPAGQPARLLTVAMMRAGDKLESYRRLAVALRRLRSDWRLTVIGDGPEEPAVRALFADLADRVAFLGRVEAGPALHARYAEADCFVWPGVGEGVGLVWLEAQAAGCPVVAEEGPAARALIGAGQLVPSADADAFAAGVERCVAERSGLSRRAREHVVAHHSLANAARILGGWLDAVTAVRACP